MIYVTANISVVLLII